MVPERRNKGRSSRDCRVLVEGCTPNNLRVGEGAWDGEVQPLPLPLVQSGRDPDKHTLGRGPGSSWTFRKDSEHDPGRVPSTEPHVLGPLQSFPDALFGSTRTPPPRVPDPESRNLSRTDPDSPGPDPVLSGRTQRL